MSDFNTSKVDGNTVGSAEWNQLSDVDNLISTSGQTPSTSNLEQIAIASARYSSAGNFYTDGGTANTYVLSPVSPFKSPVSATSGEGYFVGMTIRFRTGNANTGASTVNVNGAGVKNLKKADGTDLTTGDILTNNDVMFRYDGTNFVKVENINPATTTTLGTIQIATNAEAQAYTNSSKAIVPSSLASALNQFAIFEDQKASGTAGGTPTTGARNTRTLNTTVTNTITGCSIASNQITLPAGTYFVRGYSMAGAVNGHKLYLRNFSDSSDSLIGMSVSCPLTVGVNLMSIIEGIITIASSKVFELQHYIGSNGSGTNGLGYAVTDGNVEKYSRILIQKIG